jgi:hypothetical protein
LLEVGVFFANKKIIINLFYFNLFLLFSVWFELSKMYFKQECMVLVLFAIAYIIAMGNKSFFCIEFYSSIFKFCNFFLAHTVVVPPIVVIGYIGSLFYALYSGSVIAVTAYREGIAEAFRATGQCIIDTIKAVNSAVIGGDDD